MKTNSTSSNLLTIIIACMLLFVFNPDAEIHKAEINNSFKKENEVLGVLGGGKILTWTTKYEDYFLFSTSEIDGVVVSYGLLGKVFVVQDLKITV